MPHDPVGVEPAVGNFHLRLTAERFHGSARLPHHRRIVAEAKRMIVELRGELHLGPSPAVVADSLGC